MTRNTARTGALALLMAGVCAMALPARACPIPVYQYALEWWERDPYEVYVFDTGTLTQEQEAAIDRLHQISRKQEGGQPANLRLRRVQHESEARLHAHSALRGETPESLPWVAVYYPAVSRNPRVPVWMGALTPENIDALLDSPLRRRIGELLADRVSVVWVLLESGNARADRAARALLEREVARLEETLVTPDPAQWGADDIRISDIRFETVRLSRKDPTEQMLLAMLMKSEFDLEEYANEPMVFPIFGRGLVMDALVGAGINANMVRRTAEFLTGPCSCTVKSRNPGTDLLTTLDWGARIEPMSVKEVTGPGGLGGFLDSMREPPEPGVNGP